MLFSQYRKRKSNNWLLFSCLINFQFEFLMQSFVFYFYNKMENEIQFVFCFSFSWDNWKTNYLKISRLMSKYLYGHFYKYDLHVIQNKFVSSQMTFSVVQWSDADTKNHLFRKKNHLFRKQLIYVNVFLTGCYFHISFILLVNCELKHIRRSSHRKVFS